MTGPSATYLVGWLKEVFDGRSEISDVLAESIEESPERIEKAYRELLGGYLVDPASVLKRSATVEHASHRGSVRVSDIPFNSMCVHHFLPFFGTIDVAYRPGRAILGLGKIPRLVDCRARRFQLQENLVREIAEDMMNYGDCIGVDVVARARHLCMCYRGPGVVDAVTVTDYSLGEV